MAYAKSQETKERLLRTMAYLLRTQGYHATGVSQVLKESNIPKGSLYHHFPAGKTALAAAAVNRSSQRIMAALQAMVDNTGHPIDTLTTFCNYYIQQMKEGNFVKGCPIATITLEAAATVDPIYVECKQFFTDTTQLFIEQLQAHGAAQAEAESLATLIIASIEGGLMMSRAQRDTRPLEIIRDSLAAQLQTVLLK